jgi:hypothetical protein
VRRFLFGAAFAGDSVRPRRPSGRVGSDPLEVSQSQRLHPYLRTALDPYLGLYFPR